MTNRHGRFLWYELLTTDPDAAAAFYSDVVGWKVRHFAESQEDYRVFSAGGTDVAGMMRLPAEASGSGPVWLGYLAVDDVDAAAEDVAAAGGAIHMAPQDIPGVGRFAFVADPQGTPFYVMRGRGDGESRSFEPSTPGHVSWNELSTTDPVAALDFYAGRFGWQKGDAMPMGEMGTYQLVTQGAAPFGAVMKAPDPGDRPHWTYYVHVDDLDAATARARRHDVSILHGPAEVPGGDHILIATDPQGAMFALVGPRTSQES